MLTPSMFEPAYAVARHVASTVAEQLFRHRSTVAVDTEPSAALLPDARTVEALVDAGFWASLRREEGYVPRISLAYLAPSADVHPLTFAQALPLDPSALARLAPAVERPGIHLGVWSMEGELRVWGTTKTIPPYCFVVEVVAPGLLVLKHRPRQESRKFVNLAVIEADRIKIIDERASLLPDCPALLTSLLGFDAPDTDSQRTNVLVQLAISMRRHGRGGALLVVPGGRAGWEESIVQPIGYAVRPAFSELAQLMAANQQRRSEHEWIEALGRAVDALAGLTAVDGATIVNDRYELLAFGAKIRRKHGGSQVEQLVVTEPIEGNVPERMTPGQLGGTRHLSAAQFVSDQRDAVVLVASQDGRFTIFAWSPCDDTVHAHRIETLLL